MGEGKEGREQEPEPVTHTQVPLREKLEQSIDELRARKKEIGKYYGPMGGRPPKGLKSYLRRSKCKDPAIKAAVNDYVDQSITQLGGEENITGAQRAMLLWLRIALEVILIAEKELSKSNTILEPNGNPTSTIKTLHSFQSSFRQGQVVLGLLKPQQKRGRETLKGVMGEYEQTRESTVGARRNYSEAVGDE